MRIKRMGWGILGAGLAMFLLARTPGPAWGPETDYTGDAFRSGTFLVTAPDIAFSFMSTEESSATTFIMKPTLGFFPLKYFSVGAKASIIYTDAESATLTTYGFGGALMGFIPIGSRIYVNLDAGGGYNMITGGEYDYYGPDLSVGLGTGYFLNRHLSVGPVFAFDRVFGDPAQSIFSVGLGLRLFLTGGN